MPLISRRHFIAGLSSTAAIPLLSRAAFAAKDQTQLTVDTRVIEVKGKAAKVFSLDAAGGKQGFNFDAGQSLRLRLTNRLSEPTLVHWHGQTPPTEQDGVPVLSQPALKPGESYDYDFEPRAGTHWMHSHARNLCLVAQREQYVA